MFGPIILLQIAVHPGGSSDHNSPPALGTLAPSLRHRSAQRKCSGVGPSDPEVRVWSPAPMGAIAAAQMGRRQTCSTAHGAPRHSRVSAPQLRVSHVCSVRSRPRGEATRQDAPRPSLLAAPSLQGDADDKVIACTTVDGGRAVKYSLGQPHSSKSRRPRPRMRTSVVA